MIERIYDTFKALLYLEFPKNSKYEPIIYDRVVKNWYSGERNVIPDNVTVLISGQQNAPETDAFFGYRQITYDFNIKLYISGDDQITALRLATEGSRIIRSILNKHKRIWVMDKCFVCNKYPTSPEHFFIDSEHTAIFGVYGTEAGPTGAAGGVYNDFRTTWYKTHPTAHTPGTIPKIVVTHSGANYATAPSIIITGGGFGASGAAASSSIVNGGLDTVTMTNTGTYYTAIPNVAVTGGGGNSATAKAILVAPSTAGIAAAAYNKVLTDYQAGVVPSTLTTVQRDRLDTLVRDTVFTVREVFDVQVQGATYTDEAVGEAFMHTCVLTLQFKEQLPVTAFGPNFSGSIYNPQEAL